jgi:sucrose-phosphate synthase
MNRILVTDVDDTLTGDDEALEDLRQRLREGPDGVGFGIATGRSLTRALEILNDLDHPVPDLLITASGTALHYGSRLIPDRSWERQIRYRWQPERVLRTLQDLPGLRLEQNVEQTHYRLRYLVEGDAPAALSDVRKRLRQAGVQATPILDHERHIDVVPSRASPGLAIRFLCFKWNIPPDRLLVAGDSGNDADMLSGDTLGVVVGNHTPELDHLRGRPRIYFAEGEHAWGVVEGMEHYDFLGSIRVPDEDAE